jgi:hypothetical protein
MCWQAGGRICKSVSNTREINKLVKSRKQISLIIASLLLLTGIFSAVIVTSAAAKLKTDAQAFRDAMRKLWEDHITWTRLTIVSLANDLPDTQPTALLQEHVIIAAEIIQAAKVGDTAAQNDAIAEFLYSAKPENWPIDEMKAMMREHLTL